MKENILIVGAFGYKKNKLDGQTIKTRNIYEMLQRKQNRDIRFVDTLELPHNFIQCLRLCYYILRCRYLIVVPASRSFETLFPILYYLSKMLRYEIILLGVGGWQIEFFEGSKKYKSHLLHLKMCKNIKGFLPEINSVTEELKSKYGFDNCETFTNFRINNKTELKYVNKSNTLKLVFFARINKLKGYDIVFELANKIKKENLNILIDFYGPINDSDYDDFILKVNKNKGVVKYLGPLQPECILEQLCQYDTMLFPTRYYTEGVPGSILDAYMAGVPVISTNWKHAHEVIKDGVSGVIVNFDSPQNEFNDVVMRIYNDRTYLNSLKRGTEIGLEPYTEVAAWTILEKYIK